MDKWQNVTLQDIADGSQGFVDGPFGSNLKASEYVDDGVPVIRGSNLSLGLRRFDDQNFVFISEEKAVDLKRSETLPYDIVFTKKGTIGQTGLVPETGRYKVFSLSSNQMRLRLDTTKAVPLFVYYFVSQKKSVEKVIRDSESTGVPKTKLLYFRQFPILLPPLSEQKAIASVLGTLDDKIENNRRMNETLEEMAQAIFKSWFVDFDPVHVKAAGNAPAHMDADIAALFPSSFGDDGLPTGWNEVSADTISSITIGKTPPRKEHQWFSNSSDDVNWASIRDMGECGTYILQTTEMLTAEAINKFNVRVVPKNTVILSFKLTVGRVAITDDEIATNEAIAHFGQLDSEYGLIQPEYLYAYLKEFNFDRLGSTSSIATAVNSKTIKAMPIMLANSPCRDAFQKLALPMFSKINCNQKENQTLTELRDTLLPKLMSGEIQVADAVREVEAAT